MKKAHTIHKKAKAAIAHQPTIKSAPVKVTIANGENKPASKWLPLPQAPKDTPVLVYNGTVSVARLEGDRWHGMIESYQATEPGGNPSILTPSCWMPLPKAPESAHQ